jgi:hypothetical protein
VIVAAVSVIWTDSLITTLKVAGKEDWSIACTGFMFGAFFKAIPFRVHAASMGTSCTR